jgi:hypothetical protein
MVLTLSAQPAPWVYCFSIRRVFQDPRYCMFCQDQDRRGDAHRDQRPVGSNLKMKPRSSRKILILMLFRLRPFFLPGAFTQICR